MKADSNSKKDSVTEEPNSDEFDPNRFTVTRMPTEFLRWIIKHPLPRANPDELWKDTLPPGMEVNREQLLDDEPEVVEKSSDGALLVRPLAPARPSAKRNRRVAWMVGAIALFSAVVLGLVILGRTDDVRAPEPKSDTRGERESSQQKMQRSASPAEKREVAPSPSDTAEAELTTAGSVNDKTPRKEGKHPPPSTPQHTKPELPKNNGSPSSKPASNGEAELFIGE